MGAPQRPFDADDLCRRYQAGEPLYKLAKEAHTRQNTLIDLFKSRGIALRDRKAGVMLARERMTPDKISAGARKAWVTRHEELLGKFSESDIQALISRFQNGETVLALSKAFNTTRRLINTVLRLNGLKHRDNREDMLIRMSRMPKEERMAITKAAHAAARGRKRPLDEAVRQAFAVSMNPQLPHASHYELDLWTTLASQVSVSPQAAVGKYNIDIALHPVAVEVFVGHWHSTGNHARRHFQRVRDLFNAGWHVLVVWIKETGEFDRERAADQIAAFFEKASGNPTMGRQYRVIRGNGQLVAVRCDQCHDSAFKPSFTARDEVWCHHFGIRD